MQLGMVGLGRMGANLVRRLVRDGHTCVVYDVNADAVTALAAESDAITGVSDLDEFVAALDAPRAAWVMVPAAYAGATVMDIAVAHSTPATSSSTAATPTTATTSTGPRSSGPRASTTSTSARAAASSASSAASA